MVNLKSVKLIKYQISKNKQSFRAGFWAVYDCRFLGASGYFVDWKKLRFWEYIEIRYKCQNDTRTFGRIRKLSIYKYSMILFVLMPYLLLRNVLVWKLNSEYSFYCYVAFCMMKYVKNCCKNPYGSCYAKMGSIH